MQIAYSLSSDIKNEYIVDESDHNKQDFPSLSVMKNFARFSLLPSHPVVFRNAPLLELQDL